MNHKADKLEQWAQKRIDEAKAVIEHNRHYTDDHAFNTQPGHIPLRARVIVQNDKAYASIRKAEQMLQKAERLRNPPIKGEKEVSRQAQREYIREQLIVGQQVETALYGNGIVKRINKKTATISHTGVSGTAIFAVDLSFIRVKEDASLSKTKPQVEGE